MTSVDEGQLVEHLLVEVALLPDERHEPDDPGRQQDQQCAAPDKSGGIVYTVYRVMIRG
jgi:hypothetical protein